jgi:hypothetical protein
LPSLRQLNTTKGLLDSIEGVIMKRPDLFPIATGNAAQDGVAVTTARAKFLALTNPMSPMKGTDADVATLESNRVGLPSTVRAFGDVGNIAIPEQRIAAESIGLTPSTREAALARVENIRALLNGPIAQAGLPPLVSQFAAEKLPAAPGAPPMSETERRLRERYSIPAPR